VCELLFFFNKSNKIEKGGSCSVYGERRGVYSVLPEGKSPLWRPRRRWENYNKIEHQVFGSVGMGWIEVAQDSERWRALVNVLINFRVP